MKVKKKNGRSGSLGNGRGDQEGSAPDPHCDCRLYIGPALG